MYEPIQTTVLEVKRDMVDTLKEKSAQLARIAKDTNDVDLLKGNLFLAAGYLDGIALAFSMNIKENRPPQGAILRKGDDF